MLCFQIVKTKHSYEYFPCNKQFYQFAFPVPAGNPVISGPVPAATTALDVGRTYNYTCLASSGYPVANINWKLGTSVENSLDLHQGVSGRTIRVSESTVTNADSTLTKSSLLSWVPIADDNGKVLFCVTTQSSASGGTITKTTSSAIFVQRKVFSSNICK
jgi:hypothetical protein